MGVQQGADYDDYSIVNINVEEKSGIEEVRTAEDIVILTEIAFRHIYPKRRYDYKVSATFSGRFAPYNATISRYMNKLHLKLSRRWIGISAEIVQGLLEELLVKMFGGRNKESVYIDLYNNFIKRLHIAIPKTQSHPVLEGSFDRVNEKYFQGAVERPNLRFGGASRTKLGSYDYKTDTISISSMFGEHTDVLDYIMYHEVLHKSLKFRQSGTKNYHHTAEFRRREKEFESHAEMEEKIKRIISATRRGRLKKTGFDPFVRRLSSFL